MRIIKKLIIKWNVWCQKKRKSKNIKFKIICWKTSTIRGDDDNSIDKIEDMKINKLK